MKKTYIAPVARIYNVNPAQMMALSTDSTKITSDDITSGAFTINAKEERQSVGSVWDNEW